MRERKQPDFLCSLSLLSALSFFFFLSLSLFLVFQHSRALSLFLSTSRSMQSVQNLGLAVVAQGAGILVNQKGYLWLEMFFSVCVAMSVLAAILLWLIDDATGGKLNASAGARARDKAEKERA